MHMSSTNPKRCRRALAGRRSVPLVEVSAIAAVTLVCGGAFASNELLVPTQFPTIQAAVDAAQPGDTVVIAAGVFSGAGNQNINPQGKAITILGTKAPSGMLDTSIAPQAGSHAFVIAGSAADVVIENLRLTGATTTTWGGAIQVVDSRITIRSCSFESNSALFGGAISLDGSDALIEGAIFIGNTSNGGGAIVQHDSDVV
jgi:predicted outer membrane repeat protein